MKALTERQQEVLNFIIEFINKHSFPPTFREIGSYFDISLRAVQDHLAALEKKGCILTSGEKKQSRCIKIQQIRHGGMGFAVARRVPILGSVAAGKPVLSEENFDGYLAVAASDLKPGKHYFILKVTGTSMIGAGILDGDFALIEQQQTADNGQIVVAIIDGSATLKRFYRESGCVCLVPENPEFPALRYDDVRIAGILSRIMRTY
ncbi:MAG: transcriptional repressor LexA [Treponemataceae bacterium]|nr:MAG: transcriptional repressor LexA [Treponemataceae bacterium]